MKNSFGEDIKTGKYELYPRSTFSVTIFGNVYKPEQKRIITGSINMDLYKDIADINGLQAAKDAWWEVYKWIQEQNKL